jgi:L-asparagine transporter-like permease
MYRPGAKSRLSATKLVTDTNAVDGVASPKLNRTLSATALTMLGVGGTIGTGIFVLTGVAAAQYAGPALVLSFIIAGAGCALAGLCYAEFAVMIPVSGSAVCCRWVCSGNWCRSARSLPSPRSAWGYWCCVTVVRKCTARSKYPHHGSHAPQALRYAW